MVIWKSHVGDIDYVLSILNSFRGNILFIFEQEVNGKTSFIDVLIMMSGNSFEISIHST